MELSPAEPVTVSLDVGEVKTLTYSTGWKNGPDSDYKMSWEFEINDIFLIDPILPNTASGSFKGNVKGGSGGGGGCTISEQGAIDTVWLRLLILTCIWYVSRNMLSVRIK